MAQAYNPAHEGERGEQPRAHGDAIRLRTSKGREHIFGLSELQLEETLGGSGPPSFCSHFRAGSMERVTGLHFDGARLSGVQCAPHPKSLEEERRREVAAGKMSFHSGQMSTKHLDSKYAEYLKRLAETVEEELGEHCEVLVVPVEPGTRSAVPPGSKEHDTLSWMTRQVRCMVRCMVQCMVWCMVGGCGVPLVGTTAGRRPN